MAKVFIQESTLIAIGDAIRDRTGKEDPISPVDMPDEIKSITVGTENTGDIPTVDEKPDFYGYNVGDKILLSTDNHIYQVAWVNPDRPNDGLTWAKLVAPSGTLGITENGTRNVAAYENVDVFIRPNLQEKTATSNVVVTPDTGYDGLSKVTVNVPSSAEPKLQEKYKEVTSNGSYNVTPDKDYDGIQRVVVDVSVPEKKLHVKEIDITSNGPKEIRPDNGYDGMQEVYINVDVELEGILYDDASIGITKTFSEGITVTAENEITIDSGHYSVFLKRNSGKITAAGLLAGNIKKGVTILGVTGTYEGSGGGGSSTPSYSNWTDFQNPVINEDGATFWDTTGNPADSYVLIADLTNVSVDSFVQLKASNFVDGRPDEKGISLEFVVPAINPIGTEGEFRLGYWDVGATKLELVLLGKKLYLIDQESAIVPIGGGFAAHPQYRIAEKWW